MHRCGSLILCLAMLGGAAPLPWARALPPGAGTEAEPEIQGTVAAGHPVDLERSLRYLRKVLRTRRFDSDQLRRAVTTCVAATGRPIDSGAGRSTLSRAASDQ